VKRPPVQRLRSRRTRCTEPAASGTSRSRQARR
jgi:hypothetical protein